MSLNQDGDQRHQSKTPGTEMYNPRAYSQQSGEDFQMGSQMSGMQRNSPNMKAQSREQAFEGVRQLNSHDKN